MNTEESSLFPITFHYIEAPDSIAQKPLCRTIRAKKFRQGFKLERSDSHFKFDTYIHAAMRGSMGLQASERMAWEWYEQLQLTRISRGHEAIMRAERRLEQARAALASVKS